MNLESTRVEIHQLPLVAKLVLVKRLLSRLGLGDVQLRGRLRASEASHRGGHELLCCFDMAGFPASAVVKIVSDSVHKRMLAELAGTVIAERATFGLLIATEPASPVMSVHREVLKPANVEFIDGPKLVSLLRRFGIGVRPFGEPDFAYLQGLIEEAPNLEELFKKVGL